MSLHCNGVEFGVWSGNSTGHISNKAKFINYNIYNSKDTEMTWASINAEMGK